MAIETVLFAVGAGDTEHIDRLTEETIDMAGLTGTTVVIRHVFTKDEYDDALGNLDFDITAGEVLADDVARRHATIHELTRRSDDVDIDYVIRGRTDHHGEKLVELTGEVGADRLIVGSRKCSSIGKAVFGSVVQEVMLEVSCPVTLVHVDTR